MADIRDNTRITSLPDDLRSIADEMLAKKFNLSSKGDVVEKPKKKQTVKEKTFKHEYNHEYNNVHEYNDYLRHLYNSGLVDEAQRARGFRTVRERIGYLLERYIMASEDLRIVVENMRYDARNFTVDFRSPKYGWSGNPHERVVRVDVTSLERDPAGTAAYIYKRLVLDMQRDLVINPIIKMGYS